MGYRSHAGRHGIPNGQLPDIMHTPSLSSLKSRSQAVIAVAAATALLAACSFTPVYERPAAPVPAAFPGVATAAAPAARAAHEIPWREFFTDTRLARLIELALANNRDLRVAALNVERTRAQFLIQRADLLPTVNVSGQGVSQRISGGQTVTGSSARIDYYQAAVGVTAYEIDVFGRVRALADSALAQYLSTEEVGKSVQISLVAAVANAWLALVADHELLALTDRTIDSREQSLKLAELRHRNGVTPILDVHQARTLLEAARANAAQLARQRDLDRNALTLLVGQALPADLGGEPLKDASLGAPLVLAEVPVGLPSELLTHRPDILSAEQQLRSANANIGAARAAMFPRISLTGLFGRASSNLEDLLSAPNRFWNIAPSVALPIFDSGRNKANVEVSQVNRDIAVAQYEKAIQTAFREVADALSSRSNLTGQIDALRAQETAESERVKLVDARYKGGVGTSLDLLDAQRSLFTVQQSVIQARLLALQSQVNLYKALGGGWTSADQKLQAQAK